MAVEFITGYGGGGGDHSLAANEDDAMAVQEAASAGIHSVEKLMDMISEHKNNQPQQQQQQQQHGDKDESPEFGTVADVALSRFKEVISLLDKPRRMGHARFRRAPTSVPPVPILQLQQMVTFFVILLLDKLNTSLCMYIGYLSISHFNDFVYSISEV